MRARALQCRESIAESWRENGRQRQSERGEAIARRKEVPPRLPSVRLRPPLRPPHHDDETSTSGLLNVETQNRSGSWPGLRDR